VICATVAQCSPSPPRAIKPMQRPRPPKLGSQKAVIAARVHAFPDDIRADGGGDQSQLDFTGAKCAVSAPPPYHTPAASPITGVHIAPRMRATVGLGR
jgi:hypothetical protein